MKRGGEREADMLERSAVESKQTRSNERMVNLKRRLEMGKMLGGKNAQQNFRRSKVGR